MKKVFLIFAAAAMISACGGGSKGEGQKADSTQTVTPEMQNIHKSSVDNGNKADELNNKADSLLNNI